MPLLVAHSVVQGLSCTTLHNPFEKSSSENPSSLSRNSLSAAATMPAGMSFFFKIFFFVRFICIYLPVYGEQPGFGCPLMGSVKVCGTVGSITGFAANLRQK